MNSCIHRMNPQGIDHLIVGFHEIIRDIGNHAGFQCCREIRETLHQDFFPADQFLDRVRRFQRDLASVRSVHLVSVELGRIMTGRDHDTGSAFQVPHSIGQHGRRHQLRIEINPDAHFSQRGRRQLGKIPGMNPAVIGNSAGRIPGRKKNIPSQPPRCLINGIHVHSVASGAENTTETACSKRKIPVKTVIGFLGIHPKHHFLQFVRHAWLREPLLSLTAVHTIIPSSTQLLFLIRLLRGISIG